MDINIGINEGERRKISDGLSCLLADSYTLYLMSHNFHWNVTGPHFEALHKMFEVQYQELAEAVDQIAERIRALGFPAPATYSEFMKHSCIPEVVGVPSAEEMIALLVQGHEAVIRTAREMLEVVEDNQDQPTIDLIAKRMNIHEKTAWMLRSHLEGKTIEAAKSKAVA